MVRYILNTCCDHSLEMPGSVSSKEDKNMFFWSNMESELFTGDTSKDNYSSRDSHSPGYIILVTLLIWSIVTYLSVMFLHILICATDELSCPQNFLLLDSTSYRKMKYKVRAELSHILA